MNDVSSERWRKAQQYENLYWRELTVAELLRICAEKPAFLSMLGWRVLDSLFDGHGNVLDIGVGPAGISVASLSPVKDRIARLVKIEPLAQTDFRSRLIESDPWARTFIEWAAALAREGEMLQIRGEDVTYSAEFDTAICYNVLDHVEQPRSVLRAAFQSLRPGGAFLVGVDCLSVLGRWRFEYITRRTKANTVLVEAHPHSFLPRQVLAMLEEVGFERVRCFGLRGRLARFAGSHSRPAFLGYKPA